ncbi:hypothetical protein NE619_17895 [Anaerovorax odorimutans]|uniref:Lipoprotein n=1 Tax=Anaerovorax odorimutans TaxID=109327 RepID=A0ABT1RTW3_9FIRM|nr:hypothetical protein [Anaerovorax odorimutans]MCQ4638605.1 hypothetical protein [Anaerovorax odorimutans]
MKKKIVLMALVLVMAVAGTIVFVGCTEASQVSYNVSQEADNFNVLRRFAVINTRTDKVEFELIGAFSLEDESGNEVSKKVYVTCEMEDGSYKKHIIGLNKDTFYVVEDLGGAKVNKYKYQVNYIPESIVPITIVQHD